ncbi:YdiY family protein [Sphingorhabdus arenilitoris]|uniref:YdiY family protein n=1 Tax=Sphingorhabdus arenilitoris TaxID=1490041 RepID=A0ABV8REJ4_9SPHN
MNNFAKAAILAGLSAASPALAQASAEQALDAAIAADDTAAVEAIAKYALQADPENAANITRKTEAYKTKIAAADAAAKAAQIEEQRNASLFDNWSGRGELGAFRSSGNSSNTGLTAGLALERDGIKWRYKLSALADYQRSGGTTTREQFTGGFEANYKINKRLFGYGLGQYERDRFQGYSARYSVSAGLGYQVIDTDKMKLDVKGGPAWRQTEFVAGGSQSSLAGLTNANFAWNISPTITLRQNASAYLESANSSLTSLTALEAKINSALTARLSYQVERDSNPPAGLENTDTLSRVTIIYDF